MLTVHDWISGRAERIRMLEKLLDARHRRARRLDRDRRRGRRASCGQRQCAALQRAAAPARAERSTALQGDRADADLHASGGLRCVGRRPGRRAEPPSSRGRRRGALTRRQCHGRGRRDGAGAQRRRALALGHRRRRLSRSMPTARRERPRRSTSMSSRRSGLDPADYRSPRRQTGNWFDWPTVEGDRNVAGYASICVPGAVAGFAAALERLRHDLLARRRCSRRSSTPSAGWRSTGSRRCCIAVEAAALARDPAIAALFLDDGQAPKAGDRHARASSRWPSKARLLRRLATAGARDFYEGEIARMIARRSRGRRLGHPRRRSRRPTASPGAGRSRAAIAISTSPPFPVSAAGRAFFDAARRLAASGLSPGDLAGRRGADLRHGDPRGLCDDA